jgi:Ni,Fe-hydrogenase III component G
MANEQAIQQELATQFPMIAEKIRIARERRMFADVQREDLMRVLQYVHSKMGFTIMTTITGQDEGESFTAMYHLAHLNGTMLNLKAWAPKSDPVLPTVTKLYPTSISYERELEDLFGMHIEGLAPGRRYPLPDDFPAGHFPLRKDWKPEMLAAADAKKLSEGG